MSGVFSIYIIHKSGYREKKKDIFNDPGVLLMILFLRRLFTSPADTLWCFISGYPAYPCRTHGPGYDNKRRLGYRKAAASTDSILTFVKPRDIQRLIMYRARAKPVCIFCIMIKKEEGEGFFFPPDLRSVMFVNALFRGTVSSVSYHDLTDHIYLFLFCPWGFF